ncbi:6072_t:CDS:1, partial [Cetraspora pellucida]
SLDKLTNNLTSTLEIKSNEQNPLVKIKKVLIQTLEFQKAS